MEEICGFCRVQLKLPCIQCEGCDSVDERYRVDSIDTSEQNRVGGLEKRLPRALEGSQDGSGESAEYGCDRLNNFRGCRFCPLLICPSCFSKGRCEDPHKSDHPYSIIRDDMPVFHNTSWTGREELQLLTAIRLYGFGNWQEVAKSLIGRGPKDCEKHYSQFYLTSSIHDGLRITRVPPAIYSRFAPLPYLMSSDPPRATNACSTEMAGYNAARADFVTEYDNYAEYAVNDVEFETVDDVTEAELRLAMVNIYVKRLRERERRKRIMRKYGLINLQRNEMHYRSNQKVLGQAVVSALRTCMRLLPPLEYDKYLECLKLEVHLRNTISKLQECRKNGLIKLHHIRIYEKLRLSRAEMQRKRVALAEVIENLEDKETWQKWIQKNSIAEKIATGGALPHPALSRKAAPPLEIDGLPGSERLTPEEKELCSTVRLLPLAYFDFRDIMINEHRKDGFLRLAKARTLIKIDVNKTRKIYDFLVSQSIICKDPPAD